MDLLIPILFFYGIYWVFKKVGSTSPTPKRKKRNRKYETYKSQYGGTYPSRLKVDTGVTIKTRRSPEGNFQASGRRFSDFRYLDNPNPDEFLVYFIASEELNALKIGVGTSGRVLQLLTSTVKTDEGIINVGWKVLRTAKFSNSFESYESGREKGYEAESRVLYYWRKHLNLPSYVSEVDMGWSELYYKGLRGWHRTKGFTETVQMDQVCEESTWSLVTNSPGYLGEGSSFSNERDLNPDINRKFEGKVPPGYYEYKKRLAASRSGPTYDNDTTPAGTKSIDNVDLIPFESSRRKSKTYPKGDGSDVGKFWARVKKIENNGCWIWEGSLNDQGYGTMLWNNNPKSAHRIAWDIQNAGPLTDVILLNTCGLRNCVNPSHWESHTKIERKCMTPDCERPSQTKIVEGYCEPCRQRAKRQRRKERENRGL